jgi:inosine/xanthosine triphosphate pyrophosphatase family protein
MTAEEKDAVSHRGRAYRQLADYLKREQTAPAARPAGQR